MPVNSFDSYPLTWMPDKKSLTPPYYLSLSEDLALKIRAGLLAPGTKLPPQREIADYLDLNYTTITRVYDRCKHMGLLYGVVGKGTFVARQSAVPTTITSADLEHDCIELGSIHAFSQYSSTVEDAAHIVMERDYIRSLFEYSNPTGHMHQRFAAQRWLEQLGVHADIDNISIFSGAQNALTVALLSLFHHGDRIAVDPFTYANFIELSKLMGLELIQVPGDSYGMRPDALDKLCTANEIRGLYLMPSCANPTGICMPLSRRKEIVDVIRRHSLILLEDDITAWLLAAYGESVTSFYDLLNGESIYICGMTKSLCPGLRIAYMCYSNTFKDAILHGLYNCNIKTSSLDAEIITEMIMNGSAYQTSIQKRDLTQKADMLFCSIFPEFEASSSYYRWIPVNCSKAGHIIEQELMARGIRVYHSDRFKVSNIENSEAYLRISLCSAGSFQKLKEALCILRKYLNEQSDSI